MTELAPIKDATFYKNLIDSLPFTVAVIDSEGDIHHTNWQWDRFGLENELDPAFIGSGSNYFDICRQSDDEQATDALTGIKKVINGELDEYTQEYPCHSEDEKLWFIMRVRPFQVESTDFYQIAHSDITERVQAENQLRHAEKLASVGEMAAGLMHEINNPNASIKLHSEFLEDGWNRLKGLFESADLDSYQESIIDDFTSSVESIQNAAKRIEEIVRKVNVFAGKTEESDPETYNPNDAIIEVLEPLKEQNPEINFDLNFKIPEEQELELNAARGELQQLVTNFAKNAVDAVEGTSSPTIEINTHNSNNKFSLEIKDNGPGIPEEDQRDIFNPFYTTKEPGEGTGLGLSIANGIIERVNGDLTLESEADSGTEFIITIPVHSNSN